MTNVYLVTNITNNHVYVGITDLSVDERFKQHIAEAKKSGRKRVLQRAICLHGPDSFRIELLETHSSRSIALQREKDWIRKLKVDGWTLYNATEGGEDGKLTIDTIRLIQQRTKEAMQQPHVKAKMRLSRVGKKRGPMSEETKRKISLATKGRTVSEETLNKLRNRRGSNLGKTFSQEHRQRQSDSMKRRFAAMSDEERLARRNHIRERMNDPEVKARISEATKKALERK